MKKIINKILFFLTAGLAVSCSQSEGVDVNDGSEDTDQLITLRISPVTRAVSASADMSEKIGTMRVVILSNGKIELSKKIEFNGTSSEGVFSGEGQPAMIFDYLFSHVTFPGKKTFFLIANEESIPEIDFQLEESDKSEGLKKAVANDEDGKFSLTELLEYYNPETNPALADETDEFKTVMNSVKFTQEFSKDANGNVFIPYSAYYDNNYVIADRTKADEGALTINAKMYLVPMVTKISFNFSNYRKFDVNIDKVAISGMASSQFIHGQVNAADYNKDLDEETGLYWIDWLGKVAELSHSYPNADDNNLFNTEKGWITDYEVPVGSYPEIEDTAPMKTLLRITREIIILCVSMNMEAPELFQSGRSIFPSARIL